MCFMIFFHRKTSFKDYKNSKLKKSKNWNFSKGLIYGFGQKLVIFNFFFYFSQIGPDKMFHDILERKKNALSEYQNNKSKKSKKEEFFIGVSPSKIGNFSNFLF